MYREQDKEMPKHLTGKDLEEDEGGEEKKKATYESNYAARSEISGEVEN